MACRWLLCILLTALYFRGILTAFCALPPTAAERRKAKRDALESKKAKAAQLKAKVPQPRSPSFPAEVDAFTQHGAADIPLLSSVYLTLKTYYLTGKNYRTIISNTHKNASGWRSTLSRHAKLSNCARYCGLKIEKLSMGWRSVHLGEPCTGA